MDSQVRNNLRAINSSVEKVQALSELRHLQQVAALARWMVGITGLPLDTFLPSETQQRTRQYWDLSVDGQRLEDAILREGRSEAHPRLVCLLSELENEFPNASTKYGVSLREAVARLRAAKRLRLIDVLSNGRSTSEAVVVFCPPNPPGVTSLWLDQLWAAFHFEERSEKYQHSKVLSDWRPAVWDYVTKRNKAGTPESRSMRAFLDFLKDFLKAEGGQDQSPASRG